MATHFNSTASISLGNLVDWKKHQSGFSANTTFGQFRVLFYNDDVVRITVTQSEHFEDFSYAVVAAPSSKEYNIIDSVDTLTIETGTLVLRIQKNPVRFTFLNPAHEVINEDDEGLGTSWNGEQTTTYKKLQEGERFIGLGEKTGGLDRRGSGYQNWNTDS